MSELCIHSENLSNPSNSVYNVNLAEFGSTEFAELEFPFTNEIEEISVAEVDDINSNTVESPNNGHIGDWTFVRCREMSASQILLIH